MYRKTACTTAGLTARTAKQLAPTRGHRRYRKTACATQGSPHVPENSLHHRRATAGKGTQLRSVERTAFVFPLSIVALGR